MPSTLSPALSRLTQARSIAGGSIEEASMIPSASTTQPHLGAQASDASIGESLGAAQSGFEASAVRDSIRDSIRESVGATSSVPYTPAGCR